MSNPYGYGNAMPMANMMPYNMPMMQSQAMPNQSVMPSQAMTPNQTMMPSQAMMQSQKMMPNQKMMQSQAMPPNVPSGSAISPAGTLVSQGANEESYVENILRLNRGKMATFYMTYENNREWNAKIFRGIIEAAGRDHIIISDPATGMRYLLLMLNLDYVTFEGPINYQYPFQGGAITNQTPMPSGTPGSTAGGR